MRIKILVQSHDGENQNVYVHHKAKAELENNGLILAVYEAEYPNDTYPKWELSAKYPIVNIIKWEEQI